MKTIRSRPNGGAVASVSQMHKLLVVNTTEKNLNGGAVALVRFNTIAPRFPHVCDVSTRQVDGLPGVRTLGYPIAALRD